MGDGENKSRRVAHIVGDNNFLNQGDIIHQAPAPDVVVEAGPTQTVNPDGTYTTTYKLSAPQPIARVFLQAVADGFLRMSIAQDGPTSVKFNVRQNPVKHITGADGIVESFSGMHGTYWWRIITDRPSTVMIGKKIE